MGGRLAVILLLLQQLLLSSGARRASRLLTLVIFLCVCTLITSAGERAWFNLLFIFFPLAWLSRQLGWGDEVTFALALIAMMPLAERLGFCTEAIADHTNDTLGGLMNATMGNAPELIISLFALKEGLLRVVQVSLLGSILSNLLLVLGSGFLLGGLKHKEQTFNATTSHLNAGLLLLSVMCLLLPAVLSASGTEFVVGSSALLLSRMVSVVMLLLYCAFLVFQLKTHAFLFATESSEEEEGDEAEEGEAAASGGSSSPLKRVGDDEGEDGGEEDDVVVMDVGALGASHRRVNLSPHHFTHSKKSLPAAMHATPRSRGDSGGGMGVNYPSHRSIGPPGALPKPLSSYAAPSRRNINLGVGGGGGGAFGSGAGTGLAPSRRATDQFHQGSAVGMNGSDSLPPSGYGGGSAQSRRTNASHRVFAVIDHGGDDAATTAGATSPTKGITSSSAAAASTTPAVASSSMASTSASSAAASTSAGHVSSDDSPLPSDSGLDDHNYFPGNQGSTDALIPVGPTGHANATGATEGGALGGGGGGGGMMKRGEAGSTRSIPPVMLLAATHSRSGSARNLHAQQAATTIAPSSPSLGVVAPPPQPSSPKKAVGGGTADGYGGGGALALRGVELVPVGGMNGGSSGTSTSGVGGSVLPPSPSSPPPPPHAVSAAGKGGNGDGEHEPPLGLWTAIAWLVIVTAMVASLSEVLVGSIQGASSNGTLSEMFVSAILLPIAGNAAEHASAVIFAYKNRLDISLG